MQQLSVEEYRFLRKEILQRIWIQNFILILLIPMFMVATGLAVGKPSRGAELALAYAGTTGMGALYWIHSAARTVQIKTFIRGVEQAEGSSYGWETWLASHPISGRLGSRWFVSTKAVFVGSQLACAILCGVIIAGTDRNDAVLAAAFATAALTAFMLIQPKMKA